MIRLDANSGWPEVFLVAAALVFGFMVINWTISTESSILLSVFLGLFTATGTARLSSEASRREHTVTALLSARTDQVLHAHIEKVVCAFGDSAISSADLANNDKKNAIQSAIQILNFYEFLAKAIENGDFDEKLVRESLERQYFYACDKFKEVIRDALEKDTRKPEKTFSGILWLYKKWHGSALL